MGIRDLEGKNTVDTVDGVITLGKDDKGKRDEKDRDKDKDQPGVQPLGDDEGGPNPPPPPPPGETSGPGGPG